jgi:phosphate acetyltransferase
MSLIQELELEAKANPQRVAFPESDNEMILRAARQVADRGIGYPIIIGNEKTVTDYMESFGITTKGFVFYDNTNETGIEKLAKEYTSKFDDFSEKAVKRKGKDPVNFAMFLAKLDQVDCVAAGRKYTTADVIIAAQGIVGLKKGIDVVSSMGILDVPDFCGPQGNMLGIADCAVNVLPDEKELADIAISSAETVKNLLKWEPRVAMLSFSTCGSSEHESIDVIRNAIDIVRKTKPELKIDGEFQLDTAIIPEVAKNKVKRESEVAGKANVLIFPNLHAGNIGVKLIQIFGKANAYGPVLQGFAKPICDFSRSAPLKEMLGNIIMLIVRAQVEAGQTDPTAFPLKM